MIDSVKKNKEIGSCTCCIVTLDHSDQLISSVNLGDSGYMILRRDLITGKLAIFYESKEQ